MDMFGAEGSLIVRFVVAFVIVLVHDEDRLPSHTPTVLAKYDGNVAHVYH